MRTHPNPLGHMCLPLFSSRGATCSGKTTLAKYLRKILPGSSIIHQDVRARVIFSPIGGPSDIRQFRRIFLRSAPFSAFQLGSSGLEIQQPQALIPMHPVHGVQDWDSPAGCIEWGRMVSFLSKVRASSGEIPPDHYSHDHLNEQKEVPVNPDVIERWTQEFRRITDEKEKEGGKVVWVLLDGFLLYWNRVRSC